MRYPFLKTFIVASMSVVIFLNINMEVKATQMNNLTAGAASAMEKSTSTQTGRADAIENTAIANIREKNTQDKDKEIKEAQIGSFENLGVALVENYLNIREEPNEAANLVGKMPNDAGCEIIEVKDGWARITSGKVTGYVREEYLITGSRAQQKAEDIAVLTAKVTTEALRVRETPSIDAEIVTSMPEGEELEVIEDTGEWVKVTVDSVEGFINKDFVNISKQLNKAITMQEIQYGKGVSDQRVDLVKYAKQFIGNPYVWGGTSLTKGADCSGFVLSVFNNYGYYVPRTSREQAHQGESISLSEAQPGDLIFYGKGKTINHVAIYIGEGQVVHASSKKTGIKISNATYREPVTIRRILPV